MQSKQSNHFILYDALGENIAEEEEFLSWPITKIHTDGFTLGEAVDEDGPTDESRNHWAMIFETSIGSVRVSMESRANIRTGKRGVLAVHSLSYSGRSWSSIHRETFMWQKSGTTIRDALVFILSRGWHRFNMFTTPEGAKKGCRHHF